MKSDMSESTHPIPESEAPETGLRSGEEATPKVTQHPFSFITLLMPTCIEGDWPV